MGHLQRFNIEGIQLVLFMDLIQLVLYRKVETINEEITVNIFQEEYGWQCRCKSTTRTEKPTEKQG